MLETESFGKRPLLQQPSMDAASSGQGLEAWKPLLEHPISWVGGNHWWSPPAARLPGGCRHLCSPNPCAGGLASHWQGCSALCSRLCPPELDESPSWKTQPCNLDGGEITYRLLRLINEPAASAGREDGRHAAEEPRRAHTSSLGREQAGEEE